MGMSCRHNMIAIIMRSRDWRKKVREEKGFKTYGCVC